MIIRDTWWLLVNYLMIIGLQLFGNVSFQFAGRASQASSGGSRRSWATAWVGRATRAVARVRRRRRRRQPRGTAAAGPSGGKSPGKCSRAPWHAALVVRVEIRMLCSASSGGGRRSRATRAMARVRRRHHPHHRPTRGTAAAGPKRREVARYKLQGAVACGALCGR
jgi:hypothetical protein